MIGEVGRVIIKWVEIETIEKKEDGEWGLWG